MKSKTIVFTFLLAVLLYSCQESTAPPNVVVILCDDLGYGDLSGFGHPVIKTPHLDQLAKDGIKMTSFYSAAPVCSPSRVGLLTGRSPNKSGVYDWIPPAGESENGRHLVHMQAYEQTIPAMLKSAGYATCLSGKWHCNSEFNNEKQPQPDAFGFDHWFATHNNASPSHENPNNFVRNGEELGEIEGFSCQIVVDEALDWLKRRNEETPFYLQVTFHEPHEPVASPRHLIEKYLPFASNENEANYYANVENIDLAVGKLVKYLKEEHGENTLIVFSSDNGPETLDRHPKAFRSYGITGGLKGRKLWTTEAGMRVPGILNWLGRETFNGATDHVVSALDFFPTFCELANVELSDRPLDGESIVSLINTGEMKRTKPLLWCFYHALNQHMVAMRSNEWKILARLKSDTAYLPRLQNVYDGNISAIKQAKLTDFELYQITNDPKEENEVSEKHPEILKQLKEQLEEEYQDLLDNSYVWQLSE